MGSTPSSRRQRLADRFHPWERVEIQFAQDERERWWPGMVVRLDHPGVWVVTQDGRQWFVTNGSRIRALADPLATDDQAEDTAPNRRG